MVLNLGITKSGSTPFQGILNKIKKPAQSPGSQLPKPKVGISMTGGIPQISMTAGAESIKQGQPKAQPQVSPPRIGVSSPQALIQAGLLKTDSTPRIGVSSPEVLQKAGLLPKAQTTPTTTQSIKTQTGQPTIDPAKQAKIDANKKADREAEINQLDKYIGIVSKPGGSFNQTALDESKKKFTELTGQNYDDWKTGKAKESALADAKSQGLSSEQLKQGGFDTTKVAGTSQQTQPAQSIPGVGGMGTQQYQAGSDMYRRLVEGLANTPGSNANADFYRNQIANIMATQARANKNIDLSGIDQSLAMGQQGVLNRYYTGLQQSAQSGLQNALQQQQLQQSALGQAAGLAAPQMTSIGQVPFTPLTGEQGQMIGGPGGMFTLGQLQAQQGLGGQFAQGQVTLQAADNIQNQITQTLQQYPELNASGVSMLANLNEILSGQVSKPGQQLLKQQIESYISTLGIDPQTMMSIAAQSPGTMAQLLDSLRQTAQAKINALQGGGQTPITGGQTPTQSGGGGLWDW